MVSVVACHARDWGSNPDGPESFFLPGITIKSMMGARDENVAACRLRS